MKKYIIAIIASLAFVATTSHAGNAPVFQKNPIEDTLFIFDGSIDIKGYYSFGDVNDWGYGGSLSVLAEEFVGLEAEYFFLSDERIHNAFLNGYVLYPLADNVSLKPFVGVGGWHRNSVRLAAQGGLDLVYQLNDTFSITAGARYIYYDERDNAPAVTAGISILW